MSVANGRQVAPTLDGIRDDHVRRYQWAADWTKLAKMRTVADVGAGIGYGSWVMASAGLLVRSYELDPEAIDYGERHYRHPHLIRSRRDMTDVTWDMSPAEVVVAFEVIEHVHEAPDWLYRARGLRLLGSVPNEAHTPWTPEHPYHVRHYTPAQLRCMLANAGWRLEEMGSQRGKRGRDAEIRWGQTDGMTLVFQARRRRV